MGEKRDVGVEEEKPSCCSLTWAFPFVLVTSVEKKKNKKNKTWMDQQCMALYLAVEKF
jgi:hypothetical protein